MDTELIITILKWAGGILAAGFIAQFGKRFADWLIERRRGKKSVGPKPASADAGDRATAPDGDSKALKTLAKLEKKRLKKGVG